jgi:hypothetical protein
MTMAWGPTLKKLVDDLRGTGLFGYLAVRDRNRTEIQLECARKDSMTKIIELLPPGAVYREGTADGWREIYMPSDNPPYLLVLPSTKKERPQAPPQPAEQPAVSIPGTQGELGQSA